MTDLGPRQPADQWNRHTEVRLRTRDLRAAVLDLDLAFGNTVPRCSPECYQAHSAHAPLVSIALAPAEAPPANRWVPETEVDGEVYLVVGLADRVGSESIIPARALLRHVAHESTSAAYFQRQTEHLYQVLEGPMAGTWIIAVREGEYGPVDLLMAAWMILPVHPPTVNPDLGQRLLHAVDSLCGAAIEEERVTPWAQTELSHDARLAQGRSPLVQRVVGLLLEEGPERATLRSILGVQEEVHLREGDVGGEISLIRAVFGMKGPSTRAQRAWNRHPTHPCTAIRRDVNPCGGRAIGGDPPLCHFHANNGI